MAWHALQHCPLRRPRRGSKLEVGPVLAGTLLTCRSADGRCAGLRVRSGRLVLRRLGSAALGKLPTWKRYQPAHARRYLRSAGYLGGKRAGAAPGCAAPACAAPGRAAPGWAAPGCAAPGCGRYRVCGSRPSASRRMILGLGRLGIFVLGLGCLGIFVLGLGCLGISVFLRSVFLVCAFTSQCSP